VDTTQRTIIAALIKTSNTVRTCNIPEIPVIAVVVAEIPAVTPERSPTSSD